VTISSAYGDEYLPKTLKGSEFAGFDTGQSLDLPYGTSFFGLVSGSAVLNVRKSLAANLEELTVTEVIESEVASARARGFLDLQAAN
jgi:hypothetical protein